MSDLPKSPPVSQRPVQSGGYAVDSNWCRGVVIVYGHLPIGMLKGLQDGHDLGRHAVCDTVLSQKFGATLVLVRDAKLSDELQKQFAPKPEPGAGIKAWLAGPDVGASSRYMARKLLGFAAVPPGRDWQDESPHHPHDNGDFGRCLALLEACPELRARLPEMAECSNEWAGLVRDWDRIETAVQAGEHRAAYDLIQAAIADTVGRMPEA